jgi:cytochrome c553
MKRILFVLIVVLAAANFAAAQNYSPSTDVLGAHLNYGRGCAACHAPHSGAYGNGNAKTADSTTGNVALWGQDVGSLYGKTLSIGQSSHGGPVAETLPSSFNAGTPDVGGLLTCLSCHDGNYATGAMMKNEVYETLPSTYGTFNKIPTLLGNDNTTAGNYLNDHPVGLNAEMSCGGTYDWDCTISATGKVQMTGPNSAKFVTNYGFFVSPGTYNNKPVVLCTTCHNQHLMNVVKVTASKSGLTPGYYQTMFFIRAPYNPGSTTPGSNQTAQFCRQCHGGEANEMNNGTAVTIF